jgi:DNA helicase-2/ATP-dependent DNA helicase PcrA
MRRRVYGEEMASEPSQFLNEMPLDSVEDLSRGASWLSFARSSSALESRHAARVLRGETAKPERRFEGKTYDSADSIAEFFRQRGDQIRRNADSDTRRQPSPAPPPARPAAPKGVGRSAAPSSSSASAAGFAPGTHVKHPKYGRGLVLRREGVGDAAKLLVSFPGFGQKKLVEKYAGLEKA